MPVASWPRCCRACRPSAVTAAASAWFQMPKTPHSSCSLSSSERVVGLRRGSLGHRGVSCSRYGGGRGAALGGHVARDRPSGSAGPSGGGRERCGRYCGGNLAGPARRRPGRHTGMDAPAAPARASGRAATRIAGGDIGDHHQGGAARQAEDDAQRAVDAAERRAAHHAADQRRRRSTAGSARRGRRAP